MDNSRIDLWIECQEAICSFAMTAPSTFRTITGTVSETDFGNTSLSEFFSIAKDLDESNQLHDGKAIILEAKKRGVIEKIGGSKVVASMVMAGYAAESYQYYVAEIKRLSKLSKIRIAAQKMIMDADQVDANPQSIVAAFDTDSILFTSDSKTELTTLADAATDAMERQRVAIAKGESVGMATGFRELDQITGGLHRGQLVLLSGRTFSGKTCLALNIAKHFAIKQRRVLFCCLEMKDFELAERLLSDRAELILSQWARSDFSEPEFAKMRESITEFRGWPIEFSKSLRETSGSIRAKARIVKARSGNLDLIVVDHLQRLTPRNYQDQRHRQLQDLTQEMKHLAREIDCSVLLLTQLKTDNEDEPNDASYAEGKAILGEADQALMLHRKKDEQGGKLIVNKNRKGAPADIYLGFNGEYQRFFDNPTTARNVDGRKTQQGFYEGLGDYGTSPNYD